jgi:hypothetical protein
VYYVMWLNEGDIDDCTFGGGVASECENLDDAIEMAEQLTRFGRPCSVENEFTDICWYPEEG